MAEKNDNSGLFLGLGLLGAGLLLFSTSAAAKPPVKIDFSSLTPNEFIKLLYPLALQSEKETGVPAAVTLAQAILESGWGKSKLATDGNNFFGIKRGTNWTGQVIFLPTWECGKTGNATADGISDQVLEIFAPGAPGGNAACNSKGYYSYRVNAAFRFYNSPADSFKDHGQVLRNNTRYSKAFNYTHDPKRFANEIAAAGYATSPTYAAALLQLIDKILLALA
jgi:flagellum-specific peptidoglycan hydrolase FlgJ